MAENVKKPIEGSGTQLHCLSKHYVTVIKIIDPVTFIVRETPDPSMSKSARDFLNLEQHILSRVDECDIIPQNFLIPLKGTHVLIKPNYGKLWYRGRVETVFETSKGAMINVYLVDYGTTELVSPKAIRIPDDKVFKVPFQAFQFVLSALKPLSLQFQDNMMMRRGKAQKWDTSAVTFVRQFLSKSTTVPIQITHLDENGKFYGNMYSIDDEEICLNVELVDRSYAWLDEELIPSNENSNIGNRNVDLENTPDRVTNWLSAIEQCSKEPEVKESIASNVPLSRTPSPAPFACGDSNVPRELSPTPVLNQSLPQSLSIGRGKLLKKLSMQSVSQSQERTVDDDLDDKEKQQSHCQSPQNVIEAGENLNTMEPKGPSTMEEVRSPKTNVPVMKAPYASPFQKPSFMGPKHGFGRGGVAQYFAPVNNLEQLKVAKDDKEEWENGSVSSGSCISTVNKDSERRPSSQNSSRSARGIPIDKYLELSKKCQKTRNVSDKLENDGVETSRKPSPVESSTVGLSRYDKYTQLKGKSDENTKNSKRSGNLDPALLKPLPPNLTRRVSSDSFVNVDKKSAFDITSEIEQSDIQSFFHKNVTVQFSTDNTYQTNPSSMNDNNDKVESPTRIITYGSNPPKPLEKIEEYCFEEPIVRSLENAGIKIPTELQTYLWPAVQRSRSCVAVGLKNSGKSVGYIIPILNQIRQTEEYNYLPDGPGPIVIVLCTDWKSCQAVQAQFNMFGTFRQRNYITTLHGGDKIEDKIVDLLKGYTILVTTPSMITKLIDSDTGLDIIDRCCHLILEEANYLIEIFLKDLLRIICEFKRAVIRRGEETTTIYQIIVCTTSWSRGVKSFVKLMPNPLLYFSVYLEAAIYSEIKFHIEITELNQEHAAILAILRNAPTRNTVICASDYEKVQRLGKILKLNSHECLMAHEKMVIYEMEDIKHQWNTSAASKNNPIIVISDAILHLINITNAESLIHYNVPDVSKLQFSNRFSCLQDVIKFNESEMKGQKDGECHVIINNVNCQQCYELKRIMKSLKYPISTKLRDLAEKELLTRELCHNLLAFGNCDVKIFCRLRHKFSAEIDQPLPQYPHFGIIKIIVKFVVNAGLFYANILSYQDSETGEVVTRYRDEFADLNFKLQDHFQNLKIKEMVSNPVVGDLCAVRIVGGSYCRVKITKVHPVTKGFTQKVEVFSIDYGWIRTAELGDVFVLPKSFSSFIPQAVKIRICKVKPIDGSNLWTAQADTYVSELISNRILIGKVVMSLRDCVYVTNLGTRSDFNSSLVMRLKSQNLAIANPNHIELLRQMCDGVISWKKSPIEVHTIPLSMLITYESFEPNSVNEVFVTSVQSPSLFYAVPSQNFSGKLTDLNNLINKLYLEKKLNKAVSFKKDDVVIAPFNSEGRWYRACITRVYEDTVQLYFLDFGDNGSAVFNDVYEMPPDIVQDLPFQAVKCSLAGVKAAKGQWSQLAIDSFCDMTREDDDDDIYRPLLLKVVQMSLDLNYDRSCSVTLHFIENDASLGLELVKRGLAKDLNSKNLKDTTLNIDDENDSGEESDLSETDKLNLEFDNNAFFEWVGVDKEIIKRMRAYNQDSEPKSVENGLQHNPTLSPIPLRQLTTDGKHYPKTMWFQSDDLVIVHIELPSCSDYSAEISEKFISFQTIHGNKFYDFKEDLFDDVDVGSSNVENLPEKVKFKLRKCTVGQKWPRLTKSTDKKWYIKLHVDHLECDDVTKVVCRPPPVRGSYIRHYDDTSSSDEDYNDGLLDMEDI